jgi:hypothetical protein
LIRGEREERERRERSERYREEGSGGTAFVLCII